jgi:golgi-specific brefeldin A-resistance guanine nucleotide exchange factor 1
MGSADSGATQPLCAIDPHSLIINEIILVTSAMRKSARWASSGVAAILGGSSNGDDEDEGLAVRWGLRRGKRSSQSADSTLMAEFAKLRGELADCKGSPLSNALMGDITTFDLPSLLAPFLAVIRSSSTSGQITSLALTAIMKFFSYRIITNSSPRLALAMQMLSSAVTHCRFEATDPAQDEVVLLRILKTMEMMLSGVGGGLLGDESICEMMETGLSMCCQTRLSEMLRRSAEMAMLGMVQTVFERFVSAHNTLMG